VKRLFFKDYMLSIVFMALFVAMLMVTNGDPAFAAGADTTDNPSASSPTYQVIVLPIMGTFTGSSTKVGVARLRAHWPMYVLACHSAVQYTDAKAARLQHRLVYSNGTSVFSNLSSSNQLVSDKVGKTVKDETDIRVDLIGPGAGHTVKNPTLDIAIKRR
jgi:hypothetical protein